MPPRPGRRQYPSHAAANPQGLGDMGTHLLGVERGECSTMCRCQVLQGSGAVCAPLREKDVEPDPNCAGTAGRVSYPRRLQDGSGTQTSQRFVQELDIPLDKGCARGMWSSPHEGLHQYPSFYNCNVCGEQANILGMPGRGTDERINAAPVVV